MRRRLIVLLLSIVYSINCYAQKHTESEPAPWLKKALYIIHYQLTCAAKNYQPGHYPRSVNPDGKVNLVPITDWTSGFLPGSLWYGYELSGDKELKQQAQRFTVALDSIRYVKNTHDLGFMLYCSYGNAYRITHNKQYLPVLSDGAKNLYARFSPQTGVIRSWDFGPWHYPVIIDNMMNLEYLYWAGNAFNMADYIHAASTHALTTMKNHYRKDFSCYHWVDYDPATGKVLGKGTHQGLTDQSAWARGQAWGLYGFTMCYRNTKDQRFLNQAEHIASFLMHHPHMPEDKVPAWDFDVHNALDTNLLAIKDASAAAVMASALLNLSTQVKNGQQYIDYAEEILQSLSSDKYLAKAGENHFFILKHSVGAFLYDSEIDTPINYADYYYLEALKRFAEIKKIDLTDFAIH